MFQKTPETLSLRVSAWRRGRQFFAVLEVSSPGRESVINGPDKEPPTPSSAFGSQEGVHRFELWLQTKPLAAEGTCIC